MQQAAVNLPSRVRVGSITVRIQQRLGNGAFGVVYKVKDEASSTVYALKDVLCLNTSALLKGAQSWLNSLKSLAKLFNVVVF